MYFFALGLIVWLPIFFLIDAYLGVVAFDMKFGSVQSVFESLSNQIIFFYAILYALTFGLSAAVVYYQYSQQVILSSIELERKHSESELRLVNLKMELLHTQLSPHFLFNCLSSISALARQSDKEKIVTAIARLGDLLRFTINSSKRNFILLTEEIEFIEHYINLQKLRFSGRFEYSLEMDYLDSNLLCPPFILQPLIENAFTHGVAKSSSEVINIKVRVRHEQKTLYFELINSSNCELVGSSSDGLGMALANLEDRLSLIFDSDFSVSHGQVDDYYISKVSIPVFTDE